MNEVNVAPVEKYTVSKELMHLFCSVGAKGESFDVDELLDFLKNYIMKKQLYNPKNPFQIVCEGDALSRVFGASKFNMVWAQRKLRSLLLPVNHVQIENGNQNLCSQNESRNKRKLSMDSENEGCSHTSKRQLTSPLHFGFVSGPAYDSGKETEYSWQGYETTLAKDSTDEYESDSPHIVLSGNELYFDDVERDDSFSEMSFEYEVMSLPTDNDSDNSVSDHEVVAEIILQHSDSDLDFWADSSNCEDDCTTTSDDPDIPDSDKWQCKRCLSLTSPKIRYCERCFQLRQNWLPERNRRPPRRLRKKRRKEDVRKQRKRKRNRSSSAHALFAEEALETVPETVLSSSLEITASEPLGEQNLPGPSTSSQQSATSQKAMCFLCLEKPLDGCIVHESIGHMMACYKCLQKLKSKEQPCPLCRRPIMKIIRIIQDDSAHD